jgi:ubiquinone/menaquinone biosynthesis C-methylase UbiE
MEKPDYGSILKKDKLKFRTGKELEKYYEHKYATEGYKKGYTLFGVNISDIFHKGRHDTSFELLQPNKNDIILDAGCGNGALSLKIAKKAEKVYAIDISSNAFTKAKNKAPKNLFFQKGNVEHLKFENNFFDKIVSIETLEHVIHPDKMLSELSRTLKKDGRLILTYPTIDQTIVAKIERLLHIRDLTPVSEHLTEWDYKTVINNVEKHGLKFIKAKGIAFDLGNLGRLKRTSKKMMWKVIKFIMNRNCPRNSLFVAFEFEKL